VTHRTWQVGRTVRSWRISRKLGALDPWIAECKQGTEANTAGILKWVETESRLGSVVCGATEAVAWMSA
jgi:hypothetical protein